MGRFGCVQWAGVVITIFFFLFLPACGGHKPAGTNPFPAKITLNPSISASMQWGSTLAFTASAQNGANATISPAFTFSLTPDSPPGILSISPSGFACAGTWNAPYYNVCTPAGSGTVQVIATALGPDQPAHHGIRPSSHRQRSDQCGSSGEFSASRVPFADRTSSGLSDPV